jgi:hypothetical protein
MAGDSSRSRTLFSALSPVLAVGEHNLHLNLARVVRADAGSSDTTDLFTQDVEIHFPKFGVRRGHEAFEQLAQGLLGSLERISHNVPRCTFTAAGQTVFVEGYTHGATRTCAEWVGGSTPGGRFCSVFAFRGSKLSRMSI